VQLKILKKMPRNFFFETFILHVKTGSLYWQSRELPDKKIAPSPPERFIEHMFIASQ